MYHHQSSRPALTALLIRWPARALRLGACCAALLPAGAGFAQSNTSAEAQTGPDSPIVPVHDEPHHRQVFQFGPTRILDLQIPPNDRAWFHTHEWPVLYMTLGQSQTRSQNLGSDWSGGGRRGAPPAGRRGAAPAAPVSAAPEPRPAPRAFSTTSYIENPITHRLENIGDQLFRAMVVINETTGDESLSPDEAGFDGEPEMTNAWFRSYRVTLDAGETTAIHEHRTPVVILQAIEGQGLSTGPMNFEFNEPGQWAFYTAETAHSIRNTGASPIELLEIEVRQP